MERDSGHGSMQRFLTALLLRGTIHFAIPVVALCLAGCGDQSPSGLQVASHRNRTTRSWKGNAMSVGYSLDHWKQFGGSLRDSIKYTDRLVSVEDVDALAAALLKFRRREVPNATGDALAELVALFQVMGNEELVEAAKHVALPQLRPFIEDAVANPGVWSERGEMLALKVIAMYGVAEDVQLLSSAIEAQIHPDHTTWEVVISCIQPENGRRLFENIGDENSDRRDWGLLTRPGQ